MFLTRIGFNSKAVITGDVTQIDLPRSTKSGLRHAMEVLSKVSELSFNYFESKDIVRHPSGGKKWYKLTKNGKLKMKFVAKKSQHSVELNVNKKVRSEK